MTKKLTLFIYALVFIIPLHAQWNEDAAINKRISNLTGDQTLPKISKGPDGDYFIGYFSQENNNYNVRLQKLDHKGNILWPENGILISDHESMTWITDWDMTVDHENHAVITFQDIRTGDNNTVAYRISPEGDFVWGEDGIMLSSTANFDVSPIVAITHSNNAVFAWQSNNNIIMQKINPAGEKQWGEWGLTMTDPTIRFTWPQLLPVGEDDFIMKYYQDTGPFNAPTRRLFAQRYNSSGEGVWDSPASLFIQGSITAWTQILPMINDGDDGFFMAWHDYTQSGTIASPKIQHVSSTGQVSFGENGLLLSNRDDFNQLTPVITMPPLADGATYIYWDETNGAQNQWGIYGQKVSATGELLWGETGKMIFPVDGQNLSVEQVVSVDDEVILLYSFALGASASSIRAAKLDKTGQFSWEPEFVYVSSASSSKSNIVVSEFDQSQWVLAWKDGRDDSPNIFAQNFTPEGTLGPVEEEEEYTLTLIAIPHEAATLYGEGSYTAGTVIPVTAELLGDYQFLHWKKDGETIGYEMNFEYTMPAENVTLEAHFELMNTISDPDQKGIRFYPNPANTFINVFVSEGNGTITLTDITGRIVYSARFNHNELYRIDASKFNNGIYIIKIESTSEVMTGRVLISN